MAQGLSRNVGVEANMRGGRYRGLFCTVYCVICKMRAQSGNYPSSPNLCCIWRILVKDGNGSFSTAAVPSRQLDVLFEFL